jgi:hypothetical protein
MHSILVNCSPHCGGLWDGAQGPRARVARGRGGGAGSGLVCGGEPRWCGGRGGFRFARRGARPSPPLPPPPFSAAGFGWGERDADLAKAGAAAAAFLPKFEAILEAPFVCGAEACWADFQLLYGLNYLEEVAPGALAPFPRLAALRASLNALPRMVDFLSSQAKPLVTLQYIREVKEAQLPAA